MSPEDAVLIAAAQVLFKWVSHVIEKYGDALEDNDRAEGKLLVAKATDPRFRS